MSRPPAVDGPKVSVVVPNYNHRRYLPERLASVFGQTFRDFEVLLLDDASTDGSRNLLAGYAGDERVRLLFNERNGGSAFAQWNKGVRAARGEYVWIAESDDSADPRLLETLVPLLDRHPNVGVAYCDSNLIDEGSRVVGVPPMDPFADERDRWSRDFVADGRAEIRERLFHDNTIPNASAVLFRREVYLRAGDADTTFRVAGDWLQWVRMLLLSDLAFVAARLNDFRRHPVTLRERTSRDGRRVFEALRVQRFLLDRLDIDRETRRRGVGRYAATWLCTVRGAEYGGSPLGHLRAATELAKLDPAVAAGFVAALPKCLAISALKRTVFRSRYRTSPQTVAPVSGGTEPSRR